MGFAGLLVYVVHFAVMANHLTILQDEQRQAAIESAHAGETFKDIAEKLGIGRGTLLMIRRRDPEFAKQLDDAMFDGSTSILEDLKEVPYIEPDPARARVKLEALRSYLELRWPSRYGKQVNVNLKVLDMRSAIDKARQRASQVIDLYRDSTGVYTDRQSVDHAQDAVNTGIHSVTCFDDLI